MLDFTIKELLEIEADILAAARLAGACIMECYAKESSFVIKQDGSPLTQADKISHEVLVKHLARYSFPIVSEEAPEPGGG